MQQYEENKFAEEKYEFSEWKTSNEGCLFIDVVMAIDFELKRCKPVLNMYETCLV
mgnify:CR=1 FL=1